MSFFPRTGAHAHARERERRFNIIKTIRQKIAEEELIEYSRKETAVEYYQNQIEKLKYKSEAVNTMKLDKIRVTGTVRRYDDALINNINTREYMTAKLKEAEAWLFAINKALEVLDDNERLVMDRLYMHKAKNNLNRVMEELHLEKTQIYRIRDEALYKFTIAYFGEL